MRRRVVRAGLLAGAVLMAACGGDDAASTNDTSGGSSGSSGVDAGEDVTLQLVGYAVPQAGNNAAQALFADTPEGEGVTWEESYGASGDQSRSVAAGLEADYVHFSVEGDVTRLVDEGLVAPDWNAGPNRGIVTQSVVVLGVRPGNPKNIQSWDDIVQEGIGIVTPNPGSSGSARWNILGAYAHVVGNGGTPEEGEAFLTEFFENVVALPGSGREATTAFLAGTGDVLLSYENEVILARQQGEELDYVVPDDTLLIENPGAVLIDADPRAQDWLAFVLGDTAQAEYAKTGFRPLNPGISVEVEGANDPANPFPEPATLFTIDETFDGWPAANETYFDEEDGIVTKIQLETGRSG